MEKSKRLKAMNRMTHLHQAEERRKKRKEAKNQERPKVEYKVLTFLNR